MPSEVGLDSDSRGGAELPPYDHGVAATPDSDADDFVGYLHLERRCFAWVMERYRGLTPTQAEPAARDWYPDKLAETPWGDMVFHDPAWHWAMTVIHGHMYWLGHPELENPPAEYWAIP